MGDGAISTDRASHLHLPRRGAHARARPGRARRARSSPLSRAVVGEGGSC